MIKWYDYRRCSKITYNSNWHKLSNKQLCINMGKKILGTKTQTMMQECWNEKNDFDSIYTCRKQIHQPKCR